MATFGGYVPTLRPDALLELAKTLRIPCTTCGHILANHHHDYMEKRWCVEVEGCTCKQFTEAKPGLSASSGAGG